MPNSILRNSRTYAWQGGLTFLFFAGCAILAAGDNDTESWVVAGLSTFAFFGMWLAIGSLVERFEISEVGVAGRNSLGMKRSIEWQELREITYHPYPKAFFRMESTSGRIVRLDFTLNDFREFARCALRLAPSAIGDEATRAVLEAAAEGLHPPLQI